MIEFIEGPERALAAAVRGTITDLDLKQILDRLEKTMETVGTVDVFVETHQVTGMQLFALASYTKRALPLLGKLKAFGRVAVVADQAWIRAGTRIESLLLPFIAYRVFSPDAREEALAWVFRRDEDTLPTRRDRAAL